MPYCTWRDYPDSSLQNMGRGQITVLAAKLRDIPIGGLFIHVDEASHSSHPPVICIKTDDSASNDLPSFKFGLNSDHSILTSGDTLVIPLCGDYIPG